MPGGMFVLLQRVNLVVIIAPDLVLNHARNQTKSTVSLWHLLGTLHQLHFPQTHFILH